MSEDKAVELINEWLNLAKEVSDMNLSIVRNTMKKDTNMLWNEWMSFEK